MPASIRRRLTLWNALGFAVVLAGFAGLAAALAARALIQQAERTVETCYRLVETDPRLAANPEGRARYWVREFDEHMGVLAAVYRADGTPVEVRPAVPRHLTTLPDAPSRTIHTGLEGDRWLLTNRTVLAGDQRLSLLLLVPLRDSDAELAALLRAMGWAVPAALVASAGGAYLLARAALAPVAALRRGADAITADRLHERLPVTNPNDELGKLATTVNAMIARLERSFAETKRFTADASHELRTPLAAIRVEAEVALDRARTADDYKAAIGSILEECERMNRLTNQLLTLAREDAGATAAELAVNLTELVRGVADTLRVVADAKRLILTVELTPGVNVQGDPVRLRQVVMNLLDNAIKYTPEGGTVRVAVVRSGGTAVVEVSDTGPGIPSEHLPKVFARFYRVDKARSRDRGGTGLGLSIAQSIVAAHGGTIELASQQGKGTTATVQLPAEPAP